MKAAAFGLALFFTFAACADAAPPKSVEMRRRELELKAKHERGKAEMLRKHQQAVKELKGDGLRHQQKIPNDAEQLRAARKPSVSLPAFNAASAPPPADCLWAFVNAAKSASTMEPLMRFLPVDEARALTERQQSYDPKVAAFKRLSTTSGGAVNGVHYSYGTAKIEMLGEAGCPIDAGNLDPHLLRCCLQ